MDTLNVYSSDMADIEITVELTNGKTHTFEANNCKPYTRDGHIMSWYSNSGKEAVFSCSAGMYSCSYDNS